MKLEKKKKDQLRDPRDRDNAFGGDWGYGLRKVGPTPGVRGKIINIYTTFLYLGWMISNPTWCRRP